ncbi:hypothetical protein [uncultured Gimesia sp.]|uniref:hypothetical protein n=1 Tax=uncultured Gimesia sp. TaxID=1678688 RepID=UPI0030D97679|tara:strand:- start:8286 stop:9908 length:1623 start_codon:yes stop_codon:yes gene_type:complete
MAILIGKTDIGKIMRVFDDFKICLAATLLWGLVLSPVSSAVAQSEQTSAPSIESRHISLRPYRIRIEIAYAPNSRLNPEYRSQLQEKLQQVIERSVGEKWILSQAEQSEAKAETAVGIYENDWLPLASSEGLVRLETEDIMKRYPQQSFEKLFLLVIEPNGIGYQVSAREFDSLSQRLSPLEKQKTYEKSFLADTIFDSIRDLFSSIITIENVNGELVTVSEQGSQYLTPDPSVSTLEKDFYFHPFLRYLNRDREVKNIQFIPWTYLILEDINRKYATCSISSGLRGILSGSRRRVETLALHVKPRYPQTNLSLIPRRTSTQSYAGMRVQTSLLAPQEVRQRQIEAKKQKEKDKTAQPNTKSYILDESLTNRSGTVTLHTDPQHPLIWLYVRSGKALVANVPYIPGIAPEVTIQIPDDRIRLNVEGELAVLNGELIEAVASLSMEMSRIRKWAKNKEWKKVDEGVRKLESGISPQQIYQDKLSVIRVSAIKAAQQQNNRAAQSRIASLCRDTADRIDRFLDPTGIIDFKIEIQDLKQLLQ